MTGPRSGAWGTGRRKRRPGPLRRPALLRPGGRPRYADGVAAGAALVVPLAVGAATGHPGTGAAVALPAVLLAMPFPEGAGRAERARCLAVRAAWTTAAGVYTALAGSGVLALALGVGVTAFTGALFPRVGTTAALAVLLTGITGAQGAPPEGLPVPGLAQLVGCAWTSALLLPLRQRPSAGRSRTGAGPRAGGGERAPAVTASRADGTGPASGGPERPPPATARSAPGVRRTPSDGERPTADGVGPGWRTARPPSGGVRECPGPEGRPRAARRPSHDGTAESAPAGATGRPVRRDRGHHPRPRPRRPAGRGTPPASARSPPRPWPSPEPRAGSGARGTGS
ncbi:hypothetical protein ACQEVS_01635 [Streptomyces sp. CA-181903]|uniref:hypothetical protein n=1 Tax=Streptomyces sp. CA-181903 TaxID=3240055 RepID=UPI003D8D7EEC